MAFRWSGRWVGACYVMLALAASCAAQTCRVQLNPQESQRPKSTKTVFDELDTKEMLAVESFLMSDASLGLVPYKDAGPTDNIIFAIEMLPPPKQQVLAFLNGSAPMPARRAYALLLLYTYAAGPQCLQVQVGPLPRPTYWEKLVYPKQLQNVSILSRPISNPEYDGMGVVYDRLMADLDVVVAEATGGWRYSADACGSKCLEWTDSSPRGAVATGRKVWTWLIKSVDGKYINPIGFEVLIDTSSVDPSEWYADKIQWANRLWNSSAEILDWFHANGNTSMYHIMESTGADAKWSSFQLRNPDTARGAVPGATLYEPAGKRYSVRGRYIQWQGWSFHVGLRSTAGMRLWDVRFKGVRVAYEVSLQQAFAGYGGDPTSSPMQAQTMYLDQAWGMGPSHYELIDGADCPSTATYFDMLHYFNSAGPEVNKNSLCLFEMDLAQPLRRHHATGSGWAASIKGYSLVLRGMSTVYNYDYQWDYLFYTDGTFEAKMVPFGYMQAAVHSSAEDNSYGYRMHYNVSGTVHEHIVQWKVDLDIAGTSNSLFKDSIQVASFDAPWSDVRTQYNYKIAHERVGNEDDATVEIDATKPMYLSVGSEAALNRWGNKKSYRIDVTKYTHNLLPAAEVFWWPAASWKPFQMYFTQHKDNELTSATVFEQSTPRRGDAPLDAMSYVDGESLVDEDIVAWVSSGTWHVPPSEDSPNSSGTAHYAGFVLRPNNMFDEDQSMDTREITMFRKDSRDRYRRVRSRVRPAAPCRPNNPTLDFGA